MVPALIAAACGGDDDEATTETTEAMAETKAAPAPVTTEAATETTATPDTVPGVEGVSCDEPVTGGVITDLTGALGIYSAHINRGVPSDSPMPPAANRRPVWSRRA